MRAPAGAGPGRYGVIGHPVSHSLSPWIHAAFAVQTGAAITYERVPAPLDGFAPTVADFLAGGGLGLNVTVPFKLEAVTLCDQLGERARIAGAVNCLGLVDGRIVGDNTDGTGLVADLVRLAALYGFAIAGSRVLLLGAGGAARGVIAPLLEAGFADLTIVARDAGKAQRLATGFEFGARLRASSFATLDGEARDVIVNATSASLTGATLPLPSSLFQGAKLAYDMMYAASPTPFMDQARHAGTPLVADGLGMLVEQAAESFRIWRGVLPQTAPVLTGLREELALRAGA